MKFEYWYPITMIIAVLSAGGTMYWKDQTPHFKVGDCIAASDHLEAWEENEIIYRIEAFGRSKYRASGYSVKLKAWVQDLSVNFGTSLVQTDCPKD